MPLHLLGKKSWNVYKQSNIEQVRKDEAAAREREEAREQRMQDEDAARRLAILRGEAVPELTTHEEVDDPDDHRAASTWSEAYPRKRRRLRGEDDTDADIRHARQDVAAGEQARSALAKRGKEHEEAPLLDHAGHLQLIPAPDEKTIRKAGKNAEAEAEKAREKEREQQLTTMRFTDAAGFNSTAASKPWYSSSKQLGLDVAEGKDAFGRSDPMRKERDQTRIVKSDPFAAMQQAQQQLKQSERDRETWRREREKEVRELERAEDARRERRAARKREKDGKWRRHYDEIDDFVLADGTVVRGREETEEERRERKRWERKHRKQRDEIGELEGFSLDGSATVARRDRQEDRRRSRSSRRRRERRHSHERGRR